jgi:hypothetical protein
MKRLMLNGFFCAAMVLGGIVVALLHRDWAAAALFTGGVIIVVVHGWEQPGARP